MIYCDNVAERFVVFICFDILFGGSFDLISTNHLFVAIGDSKERWPPQIMNISLAAHSAKARKVITRYLYSSHILNTSDSRYLSPPPFPLSLSL